MILSLFSNGISRSRLAPLSFSLCGGNALDFYPSDSTHFLFFVPTYYKKLLKAKLLPVLVAKKKKKFLNIVLLETGSSMTVLNKIKTRLKTQRRANEHWMKSKGVLNPMPTAHPSHNNCCDFKQLNKIVLFRKHPQCQSSYFQDKNGTRQ